MPSLHAYARAYGLSLPQARATLIRDGLAQWRAQSAGGAARARVLSPTQRSAIARGAARARWAAARARKGTVSDIE